MRITPSPLLIVLATAISTLCLTKVEWGVAVAAASGAFGLLVLVIAVRSPKADLRGPLLLFAIAVPMAIGTSFASELDPSIAPGAVGLCSLICTYTAFAGIWWAARPQDFFEALRCPDGFYLPTVAAFSMAIYSSYPALLNAHGQPAVTDVSPTLFLPGIAYVILAYLIAEPDARIEVFAVIFSAISAIIVVIEKGFLPSAQPIAFFALILAVYWSLWYLSHPEDAQAIFHI